MSNNFLTMITMESRLEAELRQWKEREQRYEKLFSSSVLKSKEFLKEKLRHYDEIRARTIADPTNQDKVAMRALQLERAQLARQVYPNLWSRLLDKMLSVFRINNQVAKVQQASADNTLEVRSALACVGLGEHFKQVEQQMKQGNRDFSLPVSYQVTEQERMELQLNFKRDDWGKYQFEDYKATLHSELEKGKPRQHTFSTAQVEAYNTHTAYNLLAGRAVMDANGTWKQLDQNDKDAEGNLRIKHFGSTYGFDLENALMSLPVKDVDRPQLLQQLSNGDNVSVMLEINNKTIPVSISAHPLKKEITIYDNTGNKVTMDGFKSINSSKSKANVKQLVPENRQVKEVAKSKSIKL
jgi:hypothetical protein